MDDEQGPRKSRAVREGQETGREADFLQQIPARERICRMLCTEQRAGDVGSRSPEEGRERDSSLPPDDCSDGVNNLHNHTAWLAWGTQLA